MSLKAFHIAFVVLSLGLTLGLGGSYLVRFAASSAASDLLYGVGWMICGVGLLGYARYFFRKLRTLRCP
jgi:hypothetical protein